MEESSEKFSITIFPFLKTSEAFTIGKITFKSTDDLQGLTSEQTMCVEEITNMLYLKDNLQILSATYAIIPYVDMNKPLSEIVESLQNIQSVIAYHYSNPRHIFGDLFLSSEHSSMAIFSPSNIPSSLVNPDFHVKLVDNVSSLTIDNDGFVDGYAGLYNFKLHFWVAKGSRIYGLIPCMTLNISQDLSRDIRYSSKKRIDYKLLVDLLKKTETQTSSRMFNALRWFNAANEEANNDDLAIINLSIAFESLLNLPFDDKTDRFTDTISLLLGRTPRLNIWARQFYNARSQITHEGYAQQLRFVAVDSPKVNDGPLYQSLLSYGRQVFQLCLGTLLVGSELAENACLEQKLITNHERFQKICKLLSDEKIEKNKRINLIEPMVLDIQSYRYISEPDLKIKTMLDAIQIAAKILLEQSLAVPLAIKEPLEQLVKVRISKDYIYELGIVENLVKSFNDNKLEFSEGFTQIRIIDKLVNVVWGYTFAYYHFTKNPH